VIEHIEKQFQKYILLGRHILVPVYTTLVRVHSEASMKGPMKAFGFVIITNAQLETSVKYEMRFVTDELKLQLKQSIYSGDKIPMEFYNIWQK
jgi:hypothetical protein